MINCEFCNISIDEEKLLISETTYWKIFLANEQDYLGRCIVILKRHCGQLSDLQIVEWTELKKIIDILETVLKDLFNAAMFNWTCLMNNTYKSDNPNPHIHFHVRPRYKTPVTINGICFNDYRFGHHYLLEGDSTVDLKAKVEICNKIKSHPKVIELNHITK